MGRTSNVNSARVIQVIEVKSIFGKGTDDDPVRELVEYYTLDGLLLADVDRWQENADAQAKGEAKP